MENMKTRYMDDKGIMRTFDFGVSKDRGVEVLKKRIKRLEMEVAYADDCIDRHVEEIDSLEQEVSNRDETIQELEGHIAGLEDIVCSVIYGDEEGITNEDKDNNVVYVHSMIDTSALEYGTKKKEKEKENIMDRNEVYNLPEGSKIYASDDLVVETAKKVADNILSKDEIIGKALTKYLVKCYTGEIKNEVSASQFSDIANSIMKVIKEKSNEIVGSNTITTQNITINSSSSLNPSEIARRFENANRELGMNL